MVQRLKAWRASAYFLFDVLAAVLGALFLFALVCTAKNGAGVPDEGYYYTVAHRLSLGEKMIADEWNLAQLVHLFNLLPNILYMKLTGGTEGLILFMRYLFIAVLAVFYVYVYIKLRAYKGWGVAAAVLFCAVIQQTLLTVAYFTAAPMAVLAVWLLLMCDEKKKSVPKLVFAGIVMACSILAEPFLILVFLLWFALVLARALPALKDKPFFERWNFILDSRVFFFTTLGAVAMFIPYMLWLMLSGSFEGIGAALPYLASGGEYNSGNLIDFTKFAGAAALYSPVFLCGTAACTAAAAVLRVKRPEDLKAKRIVFLCSCVFLAGGYVYALIKTYGGRVPEIWVAFLQYNNFTLLLFSPALWLLSDKKTPRLFALWLLGILFSVLVDVSSTVILASGGGLVRTACILQLPVLLEALRDPVPDKKKTSRQKNRAPALRALQGTAAVCAAVALLWNGGYFLMETVQKPWEFLFSYAPRNCEITKGPWKGLRTTKEVRDFYYDTLEDLDTILAADTERAPVCVLSLFPFDYLYMNVPYGAYSAWYEYDEPERLAAYWQLRPAQQPAYIYVPYYDMFSYKPMPEADVREKLDSLQGVAEGERTEGKAGCIIRVTRLIAPET